MQFCYFAKVIITRHSKAKRNYNHTPTMHSHVTFFEMTRTRAKRVRVMVFDDRIITLMTQSNYCLIFMDIVVDAIF
jgi:hypothetical protein